MIFDRRAFLLGVGAAAGCVALPAAADTSTRTARPGVDLQTLLSIVGWPGGGPTWVQSYAHVLEFTPTKAPKVLFAEVALLECRIRDASDAQIARSGVAAKGAFHISVRGAARALEAGTHRALERFTNVVTGRSADVPVARWRSDVLVTDAEWVSLDDEPAIRRPRGGAQIAVGGEQWYVFHSGASLGVDSWAPGAAVESTGWRVRPADLGANPVPAEYNHVSYSPVGLRPWLGYDADSPVRLLENATGTKILERGGIAPDLVQLLD